MHQYNDFFFHLNYLFNNLCNNNFKNNYQNTLRQINELSVNMKNDDDKIKLLGLINNIKREGVYWDILD